MPGHGSSCEIPAVEFLVQFRATAVTQTFPTRVKKVGRLQKLGNKNEHRLTLKDLHFAMRFPVSLLNKRFLKDCGILGLGSRTSQLARQLRTAFSFISASKASRVFKLNELLVYSTTAEGFCV